MKKERERNKLNEGSRKRTEAKETYMGRKEGEREDDEERDDILNEKRKKKERTKRQKGGEEKENQLRGEGTRRGR